ncbi:glycosyltransferase family 4 protein [Clostridium estertheticum]|uniref:glycosyltransferase family 4 protein n=1 Tax=Clostridium estertheticum TaxID=238834 RepID=UPI001C0B2CD7|nr:glycosyltransferase family 4 protein [Clostridium estertheticum]MBU3200971.1 glycosyltransferase family 4 protein [Clostridium estertheticum]WAG63393.1 glycosyltransferase family 4 protein [Clostridium estertheticum]
MKVCIITNIPSPYRVDLFNHLIDKSIYDINIIYSSKNEDNRFWKIDKVLLKNSSFLKSKTIKIRTKMDYKYIHIPFNIIAKLNDIKPDIVIGSEYNPTIVEAFIWCKLKKVKYISWSDGTLNSEKNINNIQLILRKLICREANALIASSTATKMAQLKYGAKEERIFISLLTVDINKYLIERDYNRSNKTPKLLYVGSLIKRKGLDLLFDAISLVNYEFVLNVVGEGEEIHNLEDQVQNLGIREKIKFLGYLQQNELKKLYAESDIFVLPTREDCFGLVILEAMCAGLPIICSKYADGVLDLICEGENGFIIEPYNNKQLANTIQNLLNNPEKIKAMGKSSYTKVDNFTLENVLKGFDGALKYVFKIESL